MGSSTRLFAGHIEDATGERTSCGRESRAFRDFRVSFAKEVTARGAHVILITDPEGASLAGDDVADLFVLPQVDPAIAPIVSAIPLQLLAYHTAVARNYDVDRPRNLAKSVTVE